jgi:hypothetical protein
MANTATAQPALPIRVFQGSNIQLGDYVTPVICTFDTINSNLATYTPGNGNMALVVGMLFCSGTAGNLILSSNTTQYANLNLATNEGSLLGIQKNIIMATQPGQVLNTQVSAIITPITFFIVEIPRAQFE